MESPYWQLKLFRGLNAKTRHATFLVIASFVVCLFFILGYYFDWGAPLVVLNVVLAPVMEIYLFIKALMALDARLIRASVIYVVTLTFVMTVLGVTGVSNGQASSLAANIFILKNHKQLERQIELAQKSSSSINAKAEFIVKRYRFSDSLLIYDESQELLKPMSLRSSVWRDSHSPSQFDCPHSIERVRNNFFLVNFVC